MTVRVYENPAAFKEALEHRIRARTPKDAIVARTRQLLVFDRFLARIAAVFGDAATLKGGVALELRIERARTTKDVDLRLVGSPDDLLAQLQRVARHDLGDFMTFEIAPDAGHPEIEAEGMKYDGLRFRTECRLGGKLYGQRFGVDIAFGDPMFGDADLLVADDVLGFAGISPPIMRVYPIETHIAEKLHAYTLPRKRPNSRIKDLPDLALLAGSRAIDAVRLRGALEQTFGFRATHAVPSALPDPPATWAPAYAALAREDQLPWATLADVSAAARSFLDPVLATEPVSTWDPATGLWARR
jgi:Nucleotidyl transferase AbiEii toxin, Type IV TA system